MNQTFVLTSAGRLQASLDVAYAGMAKVRQLGLTSTGGGGLLVNTASTLQLLGDWDQATRVATDALQQGVPQAFAGYLHLVIADVAAARGDVAAAEASYEAAERIAPLRGDPWFEGTLGASRAELALWSGEPAAALAVVAETLPSLDKPDYDELAARLCAVGRRAAADQAARARLLPDQTGPDAQLVKHLTVREQQCRDGAARGATPAIDAYLLQGEGETSRQDGRHDHELWAKVAAAWQALSQPYPRAYALWREAEALVAERSKRKAGALVAEAHRRRRRARCHSAAARAAGAGRSRDAHGRRPGRAQAGTRQHRAAARSHPRASRRFCHSSRPGAPTGRSPAPSSSARRP